MRKMYILILSFVVIFLGLLYICSFKPSTNIFKSIYQSYGYVYKEGKRIEIDLYSDDKTSLIENVNANSYYLFYDNNKNGLNNVNIIKRKVGNYYIYKLSFDIFKPINDELIIKDSLLIIENKEFTLNINIGSISIFNGEIEELEYNDIYASYAYINNSLMLVGINIELNNAYNRISNICVNGITYTDTNLIIDGNMFENEVDIKSIIPDYKYNSIVQSHRRIKTQTLFIPVTYKDLIVVKGGYLIITLDGNKYLINEFDFIFNDLNIDDYKTYIKESHNVKA